MPDFNPTLVDPDITADDIDRAHSAQDAEFPIVEAQADLTAEDGPDAAMRGLIPVVPATPAQARANAKRLRDDHTFVGVGFCLGVVHGPIFRIPSLWPDANTALEHGAPVHEVGTDYASIPSGAVVGFHNDHFGHVTLSVGGGLNSTTDQHENGYESIALISRTAAWCGATRVVWYEILNGIDVWPNPAKPTPAPHLWTLQERADYLAHRLEVARANGHDHKAAQLKAWHDRMVARLNK